MGGVVSRGVYSCRQFNQIQTIYASEGTREIKKRLSSKVSLKMQGWNIPNSNNYMKKSTKVCRNDVSKLLEINRDKPFIDHLSGTTKTLLGHLCLDTCAWTPVPGHLACKCVPGSFASELLLGNLAWEPVPGNLFLGTTPILGNLVWEPCVGTCSWELLGTLGTLLRNLFLNLGNLAWEPVPGNLAWELRFLGILLRNLAWGPCLGTLLGNLAWELCLETCSWEPCLGTFSGNLAWEALPGNLAWESGFWLLRPAPGPLLWLKTPSLCCWGNMFLEILLWNRFFETLIENVSWNSCPGTFSWEPLLGNLLLGTLAWEALPGNLAWEPCAVRFGCSDLLRDLYYGWRPQVSDLPWNADFRGLGAASHCFCTDCSFYAVLCDATFFSSTTNDWKMQDLHSV